MGGSDWCCWGTLQFFVQPYKVLVVALKPLILLVQPSVHLCQALADVLLRFYNWLKKI